MTLSEDIFQWISRLNDLIIEGQILVDRVADLERENVFLQEKISQEVVRGQGMEAISRLYDDGFHICHANFARSREGEDCLFCLSFLYREGIGK